MAIYGKVRTTAPSGRRDFVNHEEVASLTDANFPVDGRITHVEEWTGKAGGNSAATVTKRFGLYLYDYTAGKITQRLGYTDAVVTDVGYGGLAGGGPLIAPVSVVRANRGATQQAVLVNAGERIGLESIDASGRSAIGEHGNANVAESVRRLIANASGIPSDPYNHTGTFTSSQVHIIAAHYTANRAPDAPVVTTPASTAPSSPTPFSTFAPTFTAVCDDADRRDGFGDYITQLTFDVYDYDAATSVNIANVPYAAPGSTSGTQTLSWQYTGPPLATNTTYRLRVTATDEMGVTSLAGVDYFFTITDTGSVTTTAPTGKQDAITGLTFSGAYSHGGAVAADKARPRLLRLQSNGSYVTEQTSFAADLSPDVADGGTITLSWAQTNFVDLQWGTSYAIQWQVTDINGTVGAWAGFAPFTTNAAPLTPANLSPTSGNSFGSPPEVSFDLTDPDDTVATGLIGEIELAAADVAATTFSSFDVDAAGWSPRGTPAGLTVSIGRATDRTDTGAGSYKIEVLTNTATGATPPGGKRDDLPVVAGRGYVFAGSYHAGSASLPPRLIVQWLDAANAVLQTDTYDPPFTLNAWTTFTATLVAPALAVAARLNAAALATAGATGVLWFDSISTGPTGTILAATKDADPSNRWRRQLVSGNLPTFDDYQVRARGQDGTLTGSWSSPIVFTYTQGPVPSITSPADGATIATATPTATWTVTSGTQNRYRVRWTLQGAATPAADSGWIVGAAVRSHTVPVTTPLASGLYTVAVDLEAPDLLAGGAQRSVTIAYTAPAPIVGVSGSLTLLALDDEPTAMDLNWTPPDTPPNDLIRVEVARERQGLSATRVIIARFTGDDATTATGYLDTLAPPGAPYSWLVRQVVQQGANVVASPWAGVTDQVTLTSMVLCAVNDPLNARVSFRFWESRSPSYERERTFQAPAGGGFPVAVTGTGTDERVAITAELWSEDGSTEGEAYVAALEAVHTARGPLCYRDARGRRWFCIFEGGISITESNNTSITEAATFTLRRVAYTEGVTS